MKKPTYALVFALGLLVASLFLLTFAVGLFVDPFSAKAFAAGQAQSQGFGHFTISDGTESTGNYRFVFSSPDDKTFHDMTVARKAGKWAVVKLQKDWQPWKLRDELAGELSHSSSF